MSKQVVHTTSNYMVVVADNNEAYEVINTVTGVVELTEKSLPQAISVCEQANSFLKHKLWRWIAGQAEQQSESIDKNLPEADFDVEPEPTVN